MENSKSVYSTNKNLNRIIQVKKHETVNSKIKDNNKIILKQNKTNKSRSYYSYFN